MITALFVICWLALMAEAAWWCYRTVYDWLYLRAMAPIIEARLRELFEEEEGDSSP